MVQEKPHIVVVCGYGCHLDTPLKPYLDKVADFINQHDPDAVIFCGGHTQRKSALGVSEAGLMSDYLDHDQKINPGRKTMFFQEVGSYTTLENIREASELIFDQFDFVDGRITIFCEAQRAPNVDQLARHFMKDLIDKDDHIDIETASWERADPFKQAKNLIYNKLAIKYPWLGLAEREHNKRVKRAEQV